MNISIKATKTTLTPSIKANVTEKLSVLEKFLRPEDKVHVELEVNKRHVTGKLFRVEVTIHPHGYFAEARGQDFYEALDLLIPKVKQQMVKNKEKRVAKQKAGK